MRICFLSSKHPPLDKRVFDKEAVSLAEAGFDVVHLAPDEQGDVRERNVDVITYPPPRGLLGRVLQLPRLYWRASKIDADCYHCNEMDSWTVGVMLKVLRRKKIIFDVHEHYPSTFAESRFPIWLRPLIAWFVRIWIRCQLPFTDRIVLAKKSVALDYHTARKRVLLVENFTPLGNSQTVLKEGEQISDMTSAKFPRLMAIHLGLISRVRGWPQMLEALAKTKSEEIGLWVVGTFNDNSQEQFEKRVAELGLESRVKVEGWMPFDQAFARVRAAHIGMVVFQPGIMNHVMASPHKIFDYMRAGLPVIAPDFAVEVAEVVRERDCGILVDPSSSEAIAKALDLLLSDPKERTRLGENGRRAVKERYNWDAEARKLVNMYEELARSIKKERVATRRAARETSV